MSKANSPHKGSPSKQIQKTPRHKGLMTSLYNEDIRQQGQILQRNRYTTTNNPNKIFVQTISQQPNVLPYINSDYSSQPQMVNQTHSQYVILNGRQNNLMPATTNKPQQVVTNVRISPVVSGQNLSQTKIQGHYHSRVPQNNNASTYIPPPPESFLIPINSTATKVIQNRSLGKTVLQSVPISNIIPVQSVKKTFIPHHIINEIPVYTGTVYSQSGYQSSSHEQHQPRQEESGSNDESQQVLMGYYEKLYAKYEVEKQRSTAMNQQLGQALSQINYLKLQMQSQARAQTNVITPPQKRKVIDKRRLHDLLMSKLSHAIDQVVESRKQSCLRQVSNIVQSRRVTLKLPAQFLQQQQKSQFLYSQR